MPVVYCDESGGVGAGVMTIAAVRIDADAADALVDRMHAVLGFRGEFKGSRINTAERAFFVEAFIRFGGRATVAVAHMADLRDSGDGTTPADVDIYAHLLDVAVEAALHDSPDCKAVYIDDGRYDAAINNRLRANVAADLGACGRAELHDSRRSAGIQIADVIANSFYQLGIGSPRAPRIEQLIAPFLSTGALRALPIRAIPPGSLLPLRRAPIDARA